MTERSSDLGSQATHMGVDKIGPGIEMKPPDLVQEHGAGDDLTTVPGEKLQQFEFLGCEIEPGRTPSGSPCAEVELEVTHVDTCSQI